jgi:hypothetical protein
MVGYTYRTTNRLRRQIVNDTLSPELVLMAIKQGMLDDSLSEILDVARDRREVAATRKAINLDAGDEFLVINISPKYLAGERVKFVRHDGNWLECTFLNWPGGKFRRGQTIKLRHTHVGAIVHRASGTEA